MLKSLTIALLLTFTVSSCVYASVPKLNDRNAILAIIGESEAESFQGKLALAKTILNRGTLKGVYGLHSKRVVNHRYSQLTYESAKKAWYRAKKENPGEWLATGWGNKADLEVFKRSTWFNSCNVVSKVGNHFFYACTI